MQTDYLRYFVDVATLGSMSAAAKKNFMTPQGISRSISALETELCCELFQRDSNRIMLSAAGKRLLEDARQIIAHENHMRRDALEHNAESLSKRRMQFTCYCSPIFFETSLFFPASGVSTALYGKVRFLQRSTPTVVDLLVDTARTVQPELVFAGGLGLFDLFADENEQFVRRLRDAGFEYRPLMRMNDYVLVPAYSGLANAESLTKAEIRSWNLAVAASGGMERAIARHIGSDSIYVSSGDSTYRSYLCRMGEALTFVPASSLIFGVPEGTVAIPMEDPYEIEIGFAAHAGAFRDSVLADIVERLVRFYSQHRDEGLFELLDGNPKDIPFA